MEEERERGRRRTRRRGKRGNEKGGNSLARFRWVGGLERTLVLVCERETFLQQKEATSLLYSTVTHFSRLIKPARSIRGTVKDTEGWVSEGGRREGGGSEG